MMHSFKDISPKVHETAFIADGAVVIGDVEIGEDASIWPGAVVRGDVNSIRIGARSNLQDLCVVHVTHAGPYGPPGGFPTVIGEDVTIGHGAIIHACTIGDACLIGMGAILLDGARVEQNGFVGAGAVVAPGKVVGSGELWLGNPARCVRRLSEAEIGQLYYSAQHYLKLKDRYLGQLQD